MTRRGSAGDGTLGLLVTFLVASLVWGLGFFAAGKAFAPGGDVTRGWPQLLNFGPTFGALVASWRSQEPFEHLGPGRAMGMGLVLGAAAAAAILLGTYGLLWATELAPFRAPPLAPGETQTERLAGALWEVAKNGLPAALLWALGEEIGLRGFVDPALTRRMSAGRAGVVTGAVMFVWHAPALVAGDYHGGVDPWLGAACFLGTAVSLSLVMTWLRLHSESIWPAVVMHALHNTLLLGFFELRTEAPDPNRVTGEFGLTLPAVALAGAALLYVLSPPPEPGRVHWSEHRRIARGG